MSLAKVTSRGQVTLPSGVRKALDIQTGDQLLIDVNARTNTATFHVVKRTRLSDFYSALPVSGKWKGKEKENEAAGKYLAKHAVRSIGKSK